MRSLILFSFCVLISVGLCLNGVATAGPPATAENIVAEKQPSTLIESGPTEEALIYALSLIGVKYRYGGNTAETGFDCSGFIRHVFAETLALSLPRSSYAMSKLGERIEQDNLQPGDLVFYNTLKRSFSHVGLYLGDGRFVHAPSRGKTVEIVDMDDTYWRRRFNGARRLVAASAVALTGIAVSPDSLVTESTFAHQLSDKPKKQ